MRRAVPIAAMRPKRRVAKSSRFPTAVGREGPKKEMGARSFRACATPRSFAHVHPLAPGDGHVSRPRPLTHALAYEVGEWDESWVLVVDKRGELRNEQGN